MSRAGLARAAGVVALWGLACGVVLMAGGRPDPGLVAAGLLGALATWATLRSALSGDEGGEAAWRVPSDEPVRPPGRDPRLDLLQRQVEAHLVSRTGDRALPRQLVRLADQRLLDRHGVRRDADPARAAALLGADLTALERQPTRLTPAAVDALLTRIESL